MNLRESAWIFVGLRGSAYTFSYLYVYDVSWRWVL